MVEYYAISLIMISAGLIGCKPLFPEKIIELIEKIEGAKILFGSILLFGIFWMSLNNFIVAVVLFYIIVAELTIYQNYFLEVRISVYSPYIYTFPTLFFNAVHLWLIRD